MRKKTDPNSGDLQHAAKEKFIISLIQCHQLLAFVMETVLYVLLAINRLLLFHE